MRYGMDDKYKQIEPIESGTFPEELHQGVQCRGFIGDFRFRSHERTVFDCALRFVIAPRRAAF